jgi:hypothetical protein
MTAPQDCPRHVGERFADFEPTLCKHDPTRCAGLAWVTC